MIRTARKLLIGSLLVMTAAGAALDTGVKAPSAATISSTVRFSSTMKIGAGPTNGSPVARTQNVTTTPTTASPAVAVPTPPTGTMANAQFLAALVVPAQQTLRSSPSVNDKNYFGMKCFTQGAYATGCQAHVTSECTARNLSRFLGHLFTESLDQPWFRGGRVC